MKTVRLILFPIFISILANSCFILKKKAEPKPSVEHITDSTVLTDGSVVYALPMTVFTIRIGMERKIELPGPYSKYAEVLLGLQNVITEENEEWKIKSVSVSSHEEADPSEYFIIDAEKILPTNVLALKREGFIMDLNPESSHINTSASDMEINMNNFWSPDLGSDEYYVTQADTAYKRLKMDSQFVRVPYIVEKNKKLTADELAQRAARRLMELRDGKIMILTGEANVFPQSSAAIDEINRLEKEYTELFTGKSITEERSFAYHFIPAREQTGEPATLLMFSELEGPAEEGIPVTVELTPEQKTKDLTVISRQQPEASGLNNKLYYRIPEVVYVKILMGEEELYESRKLVYQFGEVMQLPANYVIGK